MLRLFCAAIAGAVMLASFAPGSSPAQHPRKPADIPAFPTNVESLSLGLGGPCATISWHNPDETRVTVFGLPEAGLTVERSPYDMQRPWTASEGCQRDGWDARIGVQWGQRFADDASNEYVAGDYHVELGLVTLTMIAGGFYEGLNPHRPHTPQAANWGGFWPFGAMEVSGRF